MNSGPTLSSGATGKDVKRLQRLLVMMKHMDFAKITGTLGPETVQVVKDFQQSHSLTVDGVVGPQTWGPYRPTPTHRFYNGATPAQP